MSEKLEITKQELLRKLDREWRSCHGQHLEEALHQRGGVLQAEEVAEYTARALGWRVTEEPALPERLRHGGGTTSPPYRVALYSVDDDSTYAWLEAPATKGWRSQAEAVRRANGLIVPYNARVAVLAVARDLDSVQDSLHRQSLRIAAQRLRAAYEAPAP